MRKIKYKKGRKALPYSLEYTGIHKKTTSEIQLYVYDDQNLSVYSELIVSDLDKCIDIQQTNWLNIHGLNDLQLLQNIGNYFNIDNFMLADILNTTRRTKIEEQHDILFFNINLQEIENRIFVINQLLSANPNFLIWLNGI